MSPAAGSNGGYHKWRGSWLGSADMCDHCGCRDYEPIAELTAEHDEIMNLARSVAVATEDGLADPLEVERLQALLELHTTKEEIGLYPLLLSTGDLEPEVCEAFENEHDDLHQMLTDGVFDQRQYNILVTHIEAEEYGLFPSAMYAFDAELWTKLSEAHHRAMHQLGIEHHH